MKNTLIEKWFELQLIQIDTMIMLHDFEIFDIEEYYDELLITEHDIIIA
jgi:hypothetical protein